MKKAKIFLLALTLLAVIGGALAFKVKVPHIFYTCDLAAFRCTLPTTTFTKWKTTATSAPGITFPAGKFNDPCTIINGVTTCTTKITWDEEEVPFISSWYYFIK